MAITTSEVYSVYLYDLGPTPGRARDVLLELEAGDTVQIDAWIQRAMLGQPIEIFRQLPPSDADHVLSTFRLNAVGVGVDPLGPPRSVNVRLTAIGPNAGETIMTLHTVTGAPHDECQMAMEAVRLGHSVPVLTSVSERQAARGVALLERCAAQCQVSASIMHVEVSQLASVWLDQVGPDVAHVALTIQESGVPADEVVDVIQTVRSGKSACLADHVFFDEADALRGELERYGATVHLEQPSAPPEARPASLSTEQNVYLLDTDGAGRQLPKIVREWTNLKPARVRELLKLPRSGAAALIAQGLSSQDASALQEALEFHGARVLRVEQRDDPFFVAPVEEWLSAWKRYGGRRWLSKGRPELHFRPAQ